jgi:steroid 5-alpha reductase family enzyme
MSLTPPHPALGVQDFVSTLLSYPSSLPFRSLADLASVEAHKSYYVNAPVLHSATTICGVITVYVYVMQMITGNASQVDGLWTFLPREYAGERPVEDSSDEPRQRSRCQHHKWRLASTCILINRRQAVPNQRAWVHTMRGLQIRVAAAEAAAAVRSDGWQMPVAGARADACAALAFGRSSALSHASVATLLAFALTPLAVVYSGHFTFHKAISHWLAPPSKVTSIFRASAAPNTIWDLIEPRLALMFFLQVCWSARLTFNAHRRGMFKKGEEDYRWPLLRAGMSPLLWHIFSIVFIAVIQNILLAATALPQYQILSTTFTKYNNAAVPSLPSRLVPGDFVIASLLLINLALQFGADHEQWVYQNFKRGKDYYGRPLTGSVGGTTSLTVPSSSKSTAADGTVSAVRGNNALGYTPADAQRGFVTKGLWAFSRHPNFACEQATWCVLIAGPALRIT